MRFRACVLGLLGLTLQGLLPAGLLDPRPKKMGMRSQLARAFATSAPARRPPPKDTLICSSLEDWLHPDCDRHCSMQTQRPADWADVQQELDGAARRGAFGPSAALAESVALTEPGQFGAQLTAKATCLVGRALRAGLPGSLCQQIQLDIEQMGVTMARMLPGRPKLNLGLEMVGENCCRKWHRDYLLCRAIVSYIGCGTEYLDNDNVNFDALNERGENEQIIKNRSEVFSAGIGDMLLMKGLNYPSTANGLVHKSPEPRYHPDGSCLTRLCLKLDVPP